MFWSLLVALLLSKNPALLERFTTRNDELKGRAVSCKVQIEIRDARRSYTCVSREFRIDGTTQVERYPGDHLALRGLPPPSMRLLVKVRDASLVERQGQRQNSLRGEMSLEGEIALVDFPRWHVMPTDDETDDLLPTRPAGHARLFNEDNTQSSGSSLRFDSSGLLVSTTDLARPREKCHHRFRCKLKETVCLVLEENAVGLPCCWLYFTVVALDDAPSGSLVPPAPLMTPRPE